MSSVTNPHDHVFRQTFGQPEVAAGYFRHNLPEELLEHIDLETLERMPDTFVDPELHPSASDLLYAVDWLPDRNSGAEDGGKEKLLLYLLLEHKSYADPLAVFQLLRYMVRIWEKHCTEHPKADNPAAGVSDDHLSRRTALATSGEFSFPVHGSGAGPAVAHAGILAGAPGFFPAG